MRRYWRRRKSTFHSGFATCVDGLLEQDSVSAMDMYRNYEVEKDRE